MNNYLVCVPSGGFADTIKSVSKCLNYCQKHGRILVVDSRSGGLRRSMSEYFQLIEDDGRVIIYPSSELFQRLNSYLSYPHALTGRLDCVQPKGEWRHGRYSYADKVSSVELTFDFHSSYEEQVLYHYWYGQEVDFSFLKLLTLSLRARSYIAERLNGLPSEFAAVHIRHTDKRVDYKSFIRDNSNRLAGRNVLICSDNREVILQCKMLLSNSHVFTVSNLPEVGGAPIHNHGTIWKYNLDQDVMNLDMLVDLFALSAADELLFPMESVMDGPDGLVLNGGAKSGFSDLANYLLKNQKLRENMLRLF